MSGLDELVDGHIELTQAGRFTEICERYYDPHVKVFYDGAVLAESMREAYDKQKGYMESLAEFDVKFVSKKIEGNVTELVFHYKMTFANSRIREFMGKHVLCWHEHRIVKEDFERF